MQRRLSTPAFREQPRTFSPADRRNVCELGFTLVELMVAMSILAMVAIGFLASVSLGFRTIALGRQRQAAAEIASARLENLRNYTMAELALSEQPAHSTDPTNPDYYVSGLGTQYDVTGRGQNEDLIVDTANGSALHFEDPVTVGTTTMDVFQYVTWVDDPNVVGPHDYRRATVVVRFKAPAVTGISRVVTASSIFTDDSVTVGGGATTTTLAGSTTTTAPVTTTTAPTTTTTVASPCPGDVTGPVGSFIIAGSANADPDYAASTNITLNQSFSDSCAPINANFSNDNATFGADLTFDALNPNVSWALAAGDGAKTVYGKVRDNSNNQTSLASRSVILDMTKPTVPATLTRTVSCSGSNRTVVLNWGTSTDANSKGYRVYRSTDGVTWQVLGTTANKTMSDTAAKSLVLRYYVVGYDKAGNESNDSINASTKVSVVKNQCS